MSSRRRLRRAVHRYRRSIRAALVGTAVAAALAVLAPGEPPSRLVVVAAADLGAGHVLDAADLAVARYPVDQVPGGSYGRLDDLVGRRLGGAVRQAEPMTDVRIEGSAALTGSPGLVEVAVRLADAGATAIVRPGDLVDVLAAAPDQAGDGLVADPSSVRASPGAEPAGAGMAAVVAGSVRVLAVPALPDSGVGTADGALVVLAVTPTTARLLASAAASARLSVLIRSGTTQP